MDGHDLPHRGDGDGLPAGLPLPPARMPAWRGGRPLKRWRYVAAFCDELMLCVGVAHVGPAPTRWWAVWERSTARLHERTLLGRGGRRVRLDGPRVHVRDGDVRVDLHVDEGAGVETVNAHGAQYVWTRKQAARPVRGTVVLGGRSVRVDGLAVVDDTAGYHARDTAWCWSAGAGRTTADALVGWNLVAGVNDGAAGSERSVWVDGVAHEVGPVAFAPDLGRVAFSEGGELRCAAEAVRERRDRLLLFSSDYVQPFGSFSGTLPGAGELREGLGVMERHCARW
jgi:hypothetical protein